MSCSQATTELWGEKKDFSVGRCPRRSPPSKAGLFLPWWLLPLHHFCSPVLLSQLDSRRPAIIWSNWAQTGLSLFKEARGAPRKESVAHMEKDWQRDEDLLGERQGQMEKFSIALPSPPGRFLSRKTAILVNPMVCSKTQQKNPPKQQLLFIMKVHCLGQKNASSSRGDVAWLKNPLAAKKSAHSPLYHTRISLLGTIFIYTQYLGKSDSCPTWYYLWKFTVEISK